MKNIKKRKLEEMSGPLLQGRQPLTKRHHTPHYELIEFLGRGIGNSHALRTKKVKRTPNFQISKKKSIILRRQFSESMKAQVIFLRFGTLRNDDQTWHTAMEVFQKTGVKV
jgi:hypothetical protein